MPQPAYRLYQDLAPRYDDHTPPPRAFPSHQLVLEELGPLDAGAEVLDLGCGTGALVARLRAAGYRATGIDAAPGMVAQAQLRLGEDGARVGRLQDLRGTACYDALVSLEFPFNYLDSLAAARGALTRWHRALRPGGLLLLQVAHAANAPPLLFEEWSPGPGGPRDVQFLSRFQPLPGDPPGLRAEYVYSCRSRHELAHEVHHLHLADVHLVARLLRDAGFHDVVIWDNPRREPLQGAMGPFVRGRRGGAKVRGERVRREG